MLRDKKISKTFFWTKIIVSTLLIQFFHERICTLTTFFFQSKVASTETVWWEILVSHCCSICYFPYFRMYGVWWRSNANMSVSLDTMVTSYNGYNGNLHATLVCYLPIQSSFRVLKFVHYLPFMFAVLILQIPLSLWLECIDRYFIRYYVPTQLLQVIFFLVSEAKNLSGSWKIGLLSL